ncbi:alpha/beta fold hydrolase [Oceanithermus sp.]
METIAYLPGYLSPPSGFNALAEKMEGYRAVHLEPEPTPSEQLERWRRELPAGAHLVTSFEAGLAAVKLAVEKEALSLVWFSPYSRVDAALRARFKALEWALEKGGVEGFLQVGAPLLFGSLMLDRGEELIAAWRRGLNADGLKRWVGALLQIGDERKWLRTLKEQPVLAVVGSEDVFTPMRYAHDVTEWIPELHGILVTLEGAGHFSFWENPREGVSIARGFIERYREFLEGPAEWQVEDDDQAPPPLRFEPEAPK